jgi:hypothetical protein
VTATTLVIAVAFDSRGAADALHSMRSAVGVLEADELPIPDYDVLNVSEAVAAIKELTTPADVRGILAYEKAHKNRPRWPSVSPQRRRYGAAVGWIAVAAVFL